jgi:hypothetical protein
LLALGCREQLSPVLKHTNMKSRITIEVDFDNGQPYIKVINDKTSDDVRDKLISFFQERLGYTSSWCKIVYPGYASSGPTQFRIEPIRPHQLKGELEAMSEQVRLLEQFPATPELSQ